jgi:hypothetical protein
MARLDRLGTAREVAQIGSVIGRGFSYGLVRAVAGMEDVVLQKALEQLSVANILLVQGCRPNPTRTMPPASRAISASSKAVAVAAIMLRIRSTVATALRRKGIFTGWLGHCRGMSKAMLASWKPQRGTASTRLLTRRGPGRSGGSVPLSH